MASIRNTGAAAANRKIKGLPEEQQGNQQPQQPPQIRNGQRDARSAFPLPATPPPLDQRRLDQQQYRNATGSDSATAKLLNKKVFKPGQFNQIDKVLSGQMNFTDLTVEERKSILSDPNFYKSGQIAKYDPAIQQQILADNNFNWDNLPKWQRAYYSASSNPALMGGIQGLVMGAGNPAGAVIGSGLGWAAGVLGYDQTKEWYDQGDNGKLDWGDVGRGAFGLLNWGAEFIEKGIGTGAQIANYAADPNKQVADLFQNFEATWNSSANFFETFAPAFQEAADPRNHKAGENALALAVLPLYMTYKVGDIILNPDKYKGNEIYLGAASPIPLDESWIKRIEEARKEIEAGRPYREVMTDIQTGILAQIGDMAGQGIADPLNFVGKAEAKVGEVTAKITGDKIAETAFSQAEGLFDARNRIQNLVNNPAEALKIDPNYKVNELGWITKSMAGLTKDNKVKAGLFASTGDLLNGQVPKFKFDINPIKTIASFVESMGTMTPEARARTGQDLLVRNLGSIMASYFNGNDVAGFSNWWKSFSKGDMTQSAELSRTMAQSPEFYTVLPAAKGFDIDGQLAVWETSEPARMAVSRIADVLGENPLTMIEDIARRGTGPEDFARIQEKLTQANAPEAKALLAEIQAGRFTEADLTSAVKAFSDGSVPFHPGQWMAETLDAIKEHYDQWAVDHFKLDEESTKTLFRVSAVMKSAQSILLLGANPGYMISNVLPTMVTRAASGVYGYMTPTSIDNFFSRMGFSLDEGFAPSRLEEGVGPGGLIDQTRQTGDAIREATLGKGKLTDIQRALGKIGSAMPFNKLSRVLEGYEGKMAYAIGIKKFWGESWRRGTGFREIPKGLLTELTNTVGNRAADILYSAIESGMTKQEIYSIVEGRSAQIQSRGLVNQAAQELNIPASKAASMLEQMGVLDELDGNLKNATSESRVRAAFEKARQTAQAEIDRQASADAIARIEHITNRIQTEGVRAITDVVMDTEMQGIEKWLQHYERMGEAADSMDSIPNADARNRIWGLKYAESNAEYRRYNAQRGSTYLGILKAVGLESGEAGRGWLSTIADTDRVLDTAYRTTRDLRDQHFKKWNNDWDNPRRNVERSQIEAQIDKAWKDATKAEARNLKKMGELLGQQYEQLFSIEAGEAARQAWEQITEFRKEMTTRRDEFRKSLEGVPAARRQQMSKDFWQNNYNYMVIEMGRIKQEAIANLDRIAMNGKGGDPTGAGAGLDPNKPQGGGSPEMQALRQQAEERARIEREKLSAVWDIAEQYSKKQPNNSSNFNRGYLQDTHHLLATLKKEEYGGDPSITNLKDAAEKLTPEQIKQILDNRETAKADTLAAEEAARAQRFQQEMNDAVQRASNRKTAENLTILQNIRKRGGIDIASWMNFGDKPEGYQPGVFSRTGKNRWALDQMARLLADDGYPIDVNNPADIGGVNQLVELIGRARAGEEIFPIGHEFIIDAEVNRAQAEFIESMARENTFNPDQWEADMSRAIEEQDFNRATELWESLPEELADTTRANGETYNDYYIRAGEEISARALQSEQDIAIAENQVRAEQAVRQQESTANTSMTRQLFREKLLDVFNLNEDMTDTVMSLTDARAESWAALGNGTADEWYATRIADVVKAGDEVDLKQNDVQWRVEDYLDQAREDLFFDTRDEFKADWVREAIKSFGLTEDLNEAGYILQDGRMLDFSGKNQGGSSGRRSLDHRDITDAFHEDYDVQYGAIDDFTSVTGSIRHDFSNGEMRLDIFGSPTSSQLRIIQDAIDSGQVENLYVDFSTQKGNVVASAQLPVTEGGEAVKNVIKRAAASLYEGNASPTMVTQFLERIAGELGGELFQAETLPDGSKGKPQPKGGVQFLDDGKAIIRAFEKADVSTVVHEIGHIFRRDLQGTDLAIIEAWADVKNGQWTRAAEEKFARGFERYLADGSAPTPKLRTVFEKFKSWMTNIYRAITGSPIDIDLNATVKEVFDRLLVGDRVNQVDVGDMLLQLGYDPKTHYINETGKITRRPELNIRVDKRSASSQADAVVSTDFQSKLNELRKNRPARTEQKVDTTVTAPAKGTDVWKMTEQEYKALLLQEQKDFATRRLEQIGRNENIDPNYADKEAAKMQAILNRNTLSYDLYGDVRESYRKAIEKALMDDQPVPENIKQAYYTMGKEGNLSQAEYRNLQQAGRGQVNELFQTADPRMPLGGYEEAAGWLPQSEVMDEGWSSEVQPLLDKMQEAAIRRLNEPQMEGAYKDLSPEGQKMLRQYLNGVTNDMASTKMAAQRWGAEKRDVTMLNYNRRYGFDKMLDVVFPYQFFYTRSMMTWAMRALDKPAWLSNYARIRNQQNRYENNLPERLRGKMRIDAPWLPDWMGDGLYIDPLSVLFTPHNFLRPFEQMTKDKNMQVIEAERILQEWAADGTTSQEEIVQAAQTRSGSTWERALAEAKIRREAEVSNPMDFVSMMFGPAWYLSTPAKLLNIGKDGPETLTELPITRTARAVDTVTNNTWAEPIGNILGLLAKPEEAFREANNLPQFGEYGDYYTDRQIANMVAEGLITSEDAQIAMIERQGEIFTQAQERVKMELAMRVPLAGFIYAGLNEGMAAAAQAAAPSLFGAGILPEGELKYRGMKDEWDEAWKLRDAGDTEAINRFFEKNPEYEAYLAKGKEPEDRLRTFLIGQIWDGYMELGETNRKEATAEMGDLFKQAFLNSETRAYDTLDIETLTQWAQMVNQRVPNVPQTASAIANPRQINYYAPDVTEITDTFFRQRKRLYGDYYELEQGYYDLPKSERASYLIANPKLKQYWNWKDGYYKRYPDLVPVFKGQVFKRVDTSNWPLGLADYVSAYAFGGDKLPNGAYKALEQVWINEGRPMDDFDTWLKSQVVPAMMYQEGAAMQP